MPDLIDHLWYGPPAAVEAGIQGQPNVIGPRVLDDTAYVTVRATEALQLPPGLSSIGPNLARAVMGEWMGDPSLVPQQITIRQFLIGASMEGIITREEAKAAASTGAVPAFVQTVFDGMPTDEGFVAEMTWRAMVVVERRNPLLALLGGMLGMDEDAMDAAFTRWAAL